MYCAWSLYIVYFLIIFDHVWEEILENSTNKDSDQLVGWEGWSLFEKDHSQQNCQAGPNSFGRPIRYCHVTQVSCGFMFFMVGFEPPNCDCSAGFDVQSMASNVCPALRNAQKKDGKSLLGAILLLLLWNAALDHCNVAPCQHRASVPAPYCPENGSSSRAQQLNLAFSDSSSTHGVSHVPV